MRIYRMELPASSVPDPSPVAIRDRALGIMATASVLALLYFARRVLVPITFAVILSLLIAPSLPRYERTIGDKLRTLNDITVGKFNALTGQVARLADRRARTDQPGTLEQPVVTGPAMPIRPLQVIETVLGSIWVPIEAAGIVLVVLVFVLLEHAALRDRAFPSEERSRGDATAEEMRRRFPHACIVAVFLPGMLLQPETGTDSVRGADKAASSLGHAVQICLDMHREPTQT